MKQISLLPLGIALVLQFSAAHSYAKAELRFCYSIKDSYWGPLTCKVVSSDVKSSSDHGVRVSCVSTIGRILKLGWEVGTEPELTQSGENRVLRFKKLTPSYGGTYAKTEVTYYISKTQVTRGALTYPITPCPERVRELGPHTEAIFF